MDTSTVHDNNSIVLVPYKFNLELKHPFIVSYGARTHQKTMVVEFKLGQHCGYGESPEIFYYNVKRDGWITKLKAINENLKGYKFTTPEELWNRLSVLPEIIGDPFLLNAIDQSAHDWNAKNNGVPLYKQLGLTLDNIPQSCFTIGLDTIDVMIEKIKQEQWPIYKIKLTANEAIEMVTALRNHTDSIFRVDANCAWTVQQTIDYSKQLKELGVEFIEQPLAKDNLDGMIEVMDKSALPIIADESCCEEADLDKCIGKFHGVNIKLAKCGGITPAIRMIKRAKEHGMKVMLGCMIEGTVGISALAHLLPLLDYVDMDGAALLKKHTDNAIGVEVSPQGVHFCDKPGTGAEINWQNIEKE